MWWTQLSGALRKNALGKRRNPRRFACELLSPVIMSLILFGAYHLTDKETFDARNYAIFESVLPSELEPLYAAVDATNGSSSGSLKTLFDMALERPAVSPTFDQFVEISRVVQQAAGDQQKRWLLDTRFGQQWGNLLSLGTLHFTPAGARVDQLMTYLNDTTSTFASLPTHVHESEAAAVKYIHKHGFEEGVWALVVLHEMENGKVDYTLRLDPTTLPNTNYLRTNIRLGLDPIFSRYFTSGFFSLARTIDAFAFSLSADGAADPGTCAPPQVVSVPFPTPDFTRNYFFAAVGYLLGLVVVMATLFPFSRLVRDLVHEKETQMRETMAAMGMSLSANSLAWYFTALATFTATAVLCTAVACASFFPRSDPRLVFLFFWLFGLSEISLAFLISTFFSRAKLAAVVGPIILFCMCLPRYVFFDSVASEASTLKAITCLLSPSAFSLAASIIGMYEHANVGVGLSNWAEDTFSLHTCVSMMLLDTVLYALLAAYLEQVLPSQHGTSRHPLFFIQPLWTALRGNTNAVSPTPRDPGMKVQLQALAKQWPGRSTRAVDNLSLDLTEGQITCLLGPNGAGKSTLVSVLTGLTPPSAGDATIYGHSLTSELAGVRQNLGLCPQRDVLFPSLTVCEHLEFFAAVRGLAGRAAAAAVDELVAAVGLQEKRHVRAKALSGGMKRKLCLAQAFMGNPRFVLLDEPTAGMDPLSRRAVWELLRQRQQHCVILLTTHFLDEADILADQIAIVTRGQLRCAGSSMALKDQFGAGYCLTLVLDGSREPQVTEGGDLSKADELSTWVKRFVPHAQLASNARHEVGFRLPREAAPTFPALLREIDSKKHEIGITAFGISPTTLDEVFVRIGAEEEAQGTPVKTPTGASIELASLAKPPSLKTPKTPSRLALLGSTSDPESRGTTFAHVQAKPLPWLSQVRVLFHKRSIAFRRDRKSALAQIGAPLMAILAILCVLTVDLQFAGPSIAATPQTYADHDVFKRSHVYVAPNGAPLGKEVVQTSKDLDWFVEHDAEENPEIGTTSNALSSHLLEIYSNGERRYGAFVFNDSIPYSIMVDWDQAKKYVRPTLELIAMAGAEEEIFNTLMARVPSLSMYLTTNATEEENDLAVAQIEESLAAMASVAEKLGLSTSAANVTFTNETECTIVNVTVLTCEDDSTGASWISTHWDKLPLDKVSWSNLAEAMWELLKEIMEVMDVLGMDLEYSAMAELMADGLEVASDGTSLTFTEMMVELWSFLTDGETLAPTFFPTAMPTPFPTPAPSPLPTETCHDDKTWFFRASWKDCDWVAKKPYKRCNKKGDDKRRAYEACLDTCDSCQPTPTPTPAPTVCQDNEQWFYKFPSQDCDWVAKKRAKRCKKKSPHFGTKARMVGACPASCGKCD